MEQLPLGSGREHITEALDQATILTMRHTFDRTGPSATAYQTLTRINREGPARLTALAAAEGLSQPSMTQLIQRLERQCLVSRITDPEDARAALVFVTDAGQALLSRHKQHRRDRLALLLATLSAEEEATLSLATRVVLPIIERLISSATSRASSTTAVSSDPHAG